MKMNYFFSFCFSLFFFSSLSQKTTGFTTLSNNVKQQLQHLSDLRTQSEENDDLEKFLVYYEENAISMPEYQLTLTGIAEIKGFYKEIFQRQNIKTFQRKADEFINLGSTIIEIGNFRKEYTDPKADIVITQNGKYWNVWSVQPNGNFKLKGEAFGFFHPVANPETLIVQGSKEQPDESDILLQKEIPFELKAYNALMEKGVRKRDGNLRSEFFMDDASVYPFADTTVTGIDRIKPYLISYSSRGTVTIDSIMCYTYDFEYSGNYVLEYDMFKVKWRVPDFSGRTEGKGIRIWKRQDDKTLRLYREIGTHNHLE
jgi:ketosteroid isomerase-like protein